MSSDQEKSEPPSIPPIEAYTDAAKSTVSLSEQHRRKQAIMQWMADMPLPPLPIFIDDGSQDVADLRSTMENRKWRQPASTLPSVETDEWVPSRPPVYVVDGSQDTAAMNARNEQYRRQPMNYATMMAAMQGGNEVFVPPETFPVLVSKAVIIPYEKTSEGHLIRAATLPLIEIIQEILKDPLHMYEIHWRKWEEIVAASYDASGLFDEVTLTPPSGDRGRDLIAVKKGFGSVRLIESVKRYKPNNEVTAEEVDALIGGLMKDPKASKGIISTTWEFAPMIRKDPGITQLIPTRLELVNGTALLERFKEYLKMKP